MELPNPKELKRLAAMCRKAGIKHFKSGTLEFTLSDDMPTQVSKNNNKKAQNVDSEKPFESDTLTDEQLLMWSTGVNADDVTGENN